MAWVEITEELFLSRLSAPERRALASAATGDAQPDPVTTVLTATVAEWRSWLRTVSRLAIGCKLPEEVINHALVDARHRVFTRLPGMAALLDEARIREWQDAISVRNNLRKLSILPPSDDEAEPADTPAGRPGPAIGTKGPSQVIPW